MGFLRQILTLMMVLAGGLTLSQAPEFAQQYRQRIGGALDELGIIISAFDAQAVRNGLDRESALNIYGASPEAFLRDQGESMRVTFERYGMLLQQQRELTLEPPVSRPLKLLQRPDPTLLANAWRDFVPAVPMDLAGLIWAAAGCLCGWAVAASFGTVRRGMVRLARGRQTA